MLTPLKSEVLQVDDLAHGARRFRTILWSFERNLELLFKDTGLAAEVDHAALAEAFSRWRQAFDSSKHLAGIDRHDFVIYAAGLMLKELVAANPITAVGGGAGMLPAMPGEIDHRLKRWPEGYAYTSFCLSVAAAVHRETGDAEPDIAQATDDPRFWDSFRENAAENPATAIAFFDMVCGQEPNWDAPDVPWMRRKFMEHRDKVATEHRDNVTTEHRDNVTTEHRDNVTTEHRDNVTTEHRDNVTTEHRDNVTTEHRDNVTTEHRDNVTTEHRDNVTTEHRDNVTTEHRDNVTTEHRDNVTTEHRDNVTTEHRDNVTTEHRDNVTTEHRDNVTTEHRDNVTTEHRDNVTTEHRDNVTTEHRDNVTTEHRDNVTTEHRDNVTTEHRDNVTTEHRDNVTTEHRDNVTTEHRDNVTTEHRDQLAAAGETDRVSPPRHGK